MITKNLRRFLSIPTSTKYCFSQRLVKRRIIEPNLLTRSSIKDQIIKKATSIKAQKQISARQQPLRQQPTGPILSITCQTLTFEQALPGNSQAIIFIKQHYEQLFHKGNISQVNTDIKQIHVQFGVINYVSKEFQGVIDVYLRPFEIQIINKNSQKNSHCVKSLKNRIFPSKQTIGEGPKEFLQKKLWIKISRAQNTIQVHEGDLHKQISPKEYQEDAHLPLRKKSQKKNWPQSDIQFEVNSNQQPKQPNPLYSLSQSLTHVKIDVKQQIKINLNSFEIIGLHDQYLRKCLDLIILQRQQVYTSIMDQNPSFLKNNLSTYGIEKPLQSLYGYLRKMTISKLPDFNQNQFKEINKQDYLDWPNLRHAIHQSLVRNYFYFKQQTQNNQPKKRVPLGLLNHLTKLKTSKLVKGKEKREFFAYKPFDKYKQSTEVQLEEIYKNRQLYVRMQLNQPIGQAPGSNAVLEIWPPFCCSSIHNHGEAYGLIKVLNNQITVQNFQDLNFLPDNTHPYQTNVYYEDQYTWLSQLSFGIHRLVNFTSQTTLSLQSYQGKRGSKQFFEFVNKEDQIYAQYYPQNDWQNYLNIPKLIKNKYFYDYYITNGNITQADIDFINDVIDYYGLMNRNSEDSKPDHSFPKFVETMRRQYEFYNKMLVQASKKKQED